MYVRIEDVDPNTFYQGDIVNDFPFFVFTKEVNLLEKISTDDSYKINKVGTFPENPKEFLAVFPIRMQRVIILTQTCDIQNNNTVMVAPIYSLTEVKSDGRLSDSNVGLVRKRRGAMKDWFYLPASGEAMEESFVDFQTIHYLPKEILSSFLEKRIVTMSDWGKHSLGWALSDFLSRPVENKHRV